MIISDVKRTLNTIVTWHGTNYMFTGCILRRHENEFNYTAELRDLRAGCSLVIARLEEVKEIV